MAIFSSIARVFRGAVQNTPSREIRTAQELDTYLRASSMDEASGATVTHETAMRVAAVYACVRILATSQAMLPLQLMRRRGEDFTLDTTHPVAAVLRRPNRWQTAMEFESMMGAHKHLCGNSYAYISRLAGAVQELIPLNPRYMQPRMREDLSIEYHYQMPGRVERVYSQSEIHHRRGLTLDGLLGMSPIEAARRAIGLSIQEEKYGGKLFANAARPSGALKTDRALSADAQDRLRKSFEMVYTGVDNAHKTLILEEGLEWQAMGMTAEDSQFLESRKFQRNEIAMFFGVPPHMIGDVDRGTSWGSGIEQQGLGFLVHTLNPHMIGDQQSLERDLLDVRDQGRYKIVHDSQILTRAQFLTRQQGLQIQYANGVISANEWRRIEGLNPREGGDEYRSGQAQQKQESGQEPEEDRRESTGRA